MNRCLIRSLSLLVLLSSAVRLCAGGGGQNVVIVVNQASSNSVQLGNYYREQREIPPQNLVRINWTGGNAVWTRSQFESALVMPLQSALVTRGLTNQIDFVVLSMDIPYRVTETNGLNSTTAALFYGFKTNDPAPNLSVPDSCSLPPASTSAYAGSEDLFRNVAPGTNPGTYLVTMMTASNLDLAKQLVNQGTFSDATFPTQTVWLAKSSDVFRNIRYQTFDNAIFNARLRDNYSLARTNSDSPLGQTNLLGYENGLYQFSILSNVFVPGAMADSLTSYGGIIFEPIDHTTLLSFLQAGASGAYGTVVEPCNYLEKFPDPQNYFYQARGFSLAECYYQSLTNPYQGLIVGEPLAAPFALPAIGAWNDLSSNALLSGTTNLSLQFSAADPRRPVQQVDLFLDDIYLQTLTNLPPSRYNVVYVTLPGKTNLNYTVAMNASLKSVVNGLAATLNTFGNTNVTRIAAFPHGDRIELRSLDSNRTGSQTYVSVSNSIGNASAFTTFIQSSHSTFLDSIAWGIRGYIVNGSVVPGTYLQLAVTQTNGSVINVGVTNNASGVTVPQFTQQFVDAVNATSGLQGSDGLAAEDLIQDNASMAEFNLRARGQGLGASRIQVSVTGTLSVSPNNPQTLSQNLRDLQPRNHLYITAGATNLPLTFTFNTAARADGFHELAAVAYEGSSVRTQKRITRNIRIQNTSLSASFIVLMGDTNTAREATLQFSVTANTNTISRIDLYSTGGLLTSATGQSSTIFSVIGSNLDVGLHPFYAVVTRSDGQQYRTETKWIRIIDTEPPFNVMITSPPTTLFWAATAGRSYDILSATNLTDVFQVRASLTPTNSAARWIETNPASVKRFYRVRVSP
jgi:uncharacterized protein (TIGR03790 family)